LSVRREVVVVMNKNLWQSEPGDSVRSILTKPFPSITQYEPCFDAIHIPHSAFTNLFKTHRNIIYIELGSQIKEPKLIVKKDAWSKQQILIKILAPDRSAFLGLMEKAKNKIFDLLTEAERERIEKNYRTYEERKVRERLKKKHNISLYIPKGYKIDVDSSDFVWISHETPHISQAVLFYEYPYTDTNTFTPKYMVKMRNHFLAKHVKGELPNTWMSTEKRISVDFKEFGLDGKYAAEIRGLWVMENDFMGGPFVSISQVDEARNRVVTVEGFVYAPRKDKRNYIRQLEAILHSFKINN